MAFNDRGTIRQRVIDYLDGRTDLDAKINAWIDDTRRDLASKYDFAYLYTEATITTSAASARYDLPADYLGHLSIFIGTKKLIRIRPGEFDAIHGDDIDIQATDGSTAYLYTVGSSEQDEPDYYIDRGMEFDLYPVPDDTYTLLVKYYANPSDWTTDTQYDFISTFHTEAVIFGAAWRGAIYLEDDAKKQEYSTEYKEQINVMKMKEKDKQNADVFTRMKSYKDFSSAQLKRIVKMNN